MDPADPDAPVLLGELDGIRPGDLVTDEGTGPLPPLPGKLEVLALYRFTDNGGGGWEVAVLRGADGCTYEAGPGHLRVVTALGEILAWVASQLDLAAPASRVIEVPDWKPGLRRVEGG